MTKHIHAESMALYAKDAAETDRPWERWEISTDSENWFELYDNPLWRLNSKYRRKQKAININGFEVPEPYRGEMENEQKYWVLCPFYPLGYCKYSWQNSDSDNNAMKHGFVHLDQESAEKQAEALLSFTKQEKE